MRTAVDDAHVGAGAVLQAVSAYGNEHVDELHVPGTE
jgi:hypothetical protein